MSPVTPVMVLRSFPYSVVDGGSIHSSLQGLQFTPKAASLIQDLFVRKIQSECLFNRLCVYSRNDVRSQFVGLLKLVDSRVRPQIDGNPMGVDVIPVAAVVAAEKLVSLSVRQEQHYGYDHMVAAAAFFLRGLPVKPALRMKADEIFLTAACSYFSAWSFEFKSAFTPVEWPVEPMSVQEYGQSWRDFLAL